MRHEQLITRTKMTIHHAEAPEHGAAFGGGVARLCELVEELGSLNKAAKAMGMAYSKAWRIMKETEAALGVTLIERQGPKGSKLTEDGRRLLSVYREVNRSVAAFANKALAEALSREFD